MYVLILNQAKMCVQSRYSDKKSPVVICINVAFYAFF